MSIGHLTDPHPQLRDTVRSWAEREVRPRITELESARRPAPELSRLVCEQGWLGATISPTYGGMGAGHLAKTVILEELSRVDAAMGAVLQASMLGAAKVVQHGDAEQRRTWLPGIAAGAVLPTIAVTEPGSGSQVLGMEGMAEREGDTYVLTGHKNYVGNSLVGDLHGVVLRTGPGSEGLSAFLVETGLEGVHVPEHRQAMGLHGFSFGELVLDRVRVPVANRLGKEGDGLKIAYGASVIYGRPNLAAVALGIHQTLLDETVTFCRQRHRNGAPLHEIGSVKTRIGSMKSRLMTARLAAYHSADLLDEGQECDDELMNAKLLGYELGMASADDAMSIHAAEGLFDERPIERYWRDMRHLFAPAGTSDVQRLRLADSALGLSRESSSANIRSA